MLQLRELQLDGVTTLLCDADGNLFPSEQPAFAASVLVTNRFLETVGIPHRFTADELRSAATGKSFRSTLMDLAGEHQVALTESEVASWVAEENRAVIERLQATLVADPQVNGPVTRLGQRYGLAVVSSSATTRLAASFAAAGLDHLFAACRRFSAQDSLSVPTSKPDPAVYLYAADQLGLACHQAVAVEDAAAGVQSAVAAGFQTIGNLAFVPSEERSARTRQLADAGVSAVVGSWAELDLLVGSGSGRKPVVPA